MTIINELFLKRRRLFFERKANFRKSQDAKSGWRTNTLRHRWGIKRWHRSMEGRRFHKKLNRFLTSRDLRAGISVRSESHEFLNINRGLIMSRGTEILEAITDMDDKGCGSCHEVDALSDFLGVDKAIVEWFLLGEDLPDGIEQDEAEQSIIAGLKAADAPESDITSESYDYEKLTEWLIGKGAISESYDPCDDDPEGEGCGDDDGEEEEMDEK